MTLLAIFGCDPNTREISPTLEGISIDAVVEQSTECRGTQDGYATDHVRVVLQDREGRTIEREDLRVMMNGVPLAPRASQGNYYDRHPFYRLDDAAAHLAPDLPCRFTLLRPDGTHH